MIDNFNREALSIEVDFSLPSERVILSLDQIIALRGKPAVIPANNGPELISGRLMEWAAKHQIHTQHINQVSLKKYVVFRGFYRCFSRTVGYEWLSQHYWESINEVQEFVTKWMYEINHQRHNKALGDITLKQRLVIVA